MGSVIRNSVSRYNGENGIMMDLRSTDNRIENNEAHHNTGDGIVTANSPRTQIVGNNVHHNRVGLRIDPNDAPTTLVNGNEIVSNRLSHQGVELPASNPTASNGGQWRKTPLIVVWLVIAAGFGLGSMALIGTNSWLRRRER